MLDLKTTPKLSLGDLNPAAAHDVNPLSTLITIFRAPDSATAVLPPRTGPGYLNDAIGFTSFFYHTVSLREAQYPLCFDALVFCLAGNSFGMTLFTKTGGGGAYPLPHQADRAALTSALLCAIRDFPRGWTEQSPQDDDPFEELENPRAAIDLA